MPSCQLLEPSLSKKSGFQNQVSAADLVQMPELAAALSSSAEPGSCGAGPSDPQDPPMSWSFHSSPSHRGQRPLRFQHHVLGGEASLCAGHS